MAENNEFIREVDEDYRREQILQVWRRYSGVIIALAVLLVAGVAGWRYWQAQQHAAAEAASIRFDAANRLARDGKVEEADKAFTALEQDGTAGYRLLSRFRAAAETSKADPAKAASDFDALAGDAALGDGLRDLARLRAALIRMDGPNPDAALANLQSLAAGSPYRHAGPRRPEEGRLRGGEPVGRTDRRRPGYAPRPARADRGLRGHRRGGPRHADGGQARGRRTAPADHPLTEGLRH